MLAWTANQASPYADLQVRTPQPPHTREQLSIMVTFEILKPIHIRRFAYLHYNGLHLNILMVIPWNYTASENLKSYTQLSGIYGP